jgi:hypothetical protein
MRKRLLVVLGLTLLICLLVPSLALARGTTKIEDVSAAYTVVKGGTLTVAGTVVGSPNASNWNRHPRLKIQRLTRGHWRTIDYVRPKAGGSFSVKLKKPTAGSYRVSFPGCSHYRSHAERFSVKYDPLLSIGTPTLTGSIRPLMIRSESIVSVTVRSSLPARDLVGGYLTIRSWASTDGVTYDLVGTVASPFAFGSSNSVAVNGILVPYVNAADDTYEYCRIEALYSGGSYTGIGSVTSAPCRVSIDR